LQKKHFVTKAIFYLDCSHCTNGVKKMSEKVHEFDVAIIGSGGGAKLAQLLAKSGRTVALFEKESAGGTCLNRGCIPSKMLIYPAAMLESIISTQEKFSLHGIHSPGLDYVRLNQEVHQLIDSHSRDVQQSLKATSGLSYIHQTVRFHGSANTLIDTDGNCYRAPIVVIATGTTPHIPSIKGLEQTPFLTSRTLLRHQKIPRSLLVVGAGYIALELGYMMRQFGADVHFLVRSIPMRTQDIAVQQHWLQQFQKNVTLHYAQAREVRHGDNHFTLTTDNGETIEAEQLLIATGVTPTTSELGCEEVGIKTDKNGYVQVDNFMQTNQKGVFAIGDVVGNYFFRHTVNHEAQYLFDYISGRQKNPIDYGPVPYAVFTHPEVAGVGVSSHNAPHGVISGQASYKDSNQGWARRMEVGLAQLYFHPQNHQLIGAHFVGEEAAALVHICVAFMKMKATVFEMNDTIYIHPTLSEVVRDAVRDARAKIAD